MTEIVEYSETEAALAVLRGKYTKAYDVSTTAGMSEATKARAEIRGYRTSLEKKRKELKAPALQRCHDIDNEAKRITAELLSLEEPIDATIKAEEQRKEEVKAAAERERQASAQAADQERQSLYVKIPQMLGVSPEQISEAIKEIANRSFMQNEYTAGLEDARKTTLEKLTAMHAEALGRVAEAKRMADERAEIDRLRAKAEAEAAAERERLAAEQEKARAEREAADKAATAAREAADREAAAAREQENKRLAAERAKLDEERAEQDARARAEREAAEAKARQEREAAEAKSKAERDAAEAKAAKERAEHEAKEAERMRKANAREFLQMFVARFGDIAEFSEVVAAIEALPPAASETNKRKGKQANG